MRRILLSICVVLAVSAGWVLAQGDCAKCNERIESSRWNFCPYCGAKLDRAGAAPPVAAGGPVNASAYESVSWNKIVFEKAKYHDRKVRFSARFTGIHHYFAPAEILGITDANYVNFAIQGNRTNYAAKTKPKVVEKLKRIRPFTTIILYAVIKVRKDVHGMGNDVYVVLVDDIDVE